MLTLVARRTYEWKKQTDKHNSVFNRMNVHQDTHGSMWQFAILDTAHMGRRLYKRLSQRIVWYCCTTYIPYHYSCS